MCGLTAGLNGLGLPNGLSGLIPFCLSLNETGGAKSIGLNTIESSLSLAGVGREASGIGGGKGCLGCGTRPLIDDMPLGGIYCLDEAIELPDM